MYITSGLTTSEEFVVFCFLSAYIQATRHRRRRPAAPCPFDSVVSPLLCGINRLPRGSRKAGHRPLDRGQIIQYRPGSALAAVSKRARQEATQTCPIRDGRCQPDCRARTTQFHNLLILLDGKLSHRRLECKQNFRQKCPQNRLRPGRLALAARPRPVPSPNSMSPYNLNLLPIGVLP
jgi:hypothetical protein